MKRFCCHAKAGSSCIVRFKERLRKGQEDANCAVAIDLQNAGASCGNLLLLPHCLFRRWAYHAQMGEPGFPIASEKDHKTLVKKDIQVVTNNLDHNTKDIQVVTNNLDHSLCNFNYSMLDELLHGL